MLEDVIFVMILLSGKEKVISIYAQQSEAAYPNCQELKKVTGVQNSMNKYYILKIADRSIFSKSK